MAGRKPKPTAIKKLEGNPGKRKLNTKKPIPAKGMPDFMSGLAKGIEKSKGMVKDAVSSVNGGSGDIVIPVYLGGTMLDEVIVNAQQRANLRSGGR